MPESLTGAWQQAIDRRAPELEERVFVFLNEQLRRMLSRYVRGQQPMTADENTWLTRILVDYYDRDLARDLLKEPPPGATEEEAKSYKTIYGTVESLDEVFRIMQSHQDAASQARLVNETTRKILEQFLTGGEDNTPDAVRSFLMSNPNFSNVTKPEFEALVKNISQQVEETYRNRARTIARTELAIAQSKTVAQELRAQGKTHVRIYDGLGCGWRHHDDGDYANGSLRRIEDYLNYPVAHPNCVRAGYPDFFGGDGSIHVGKKDLDLFEVELKYNFESLETVSANQKSLEGVSNRPDGSGGPLDLLEGSERVRKYNPYHDRLGRFSTGSGGGSGVNVAGSDEEFAFLKDAEYKRVIDPTTGAEIDVDEGLVLLMENRGFYGKPTTLEKAEFNRAEKLSLDMEYGYDPRNSSPTNIYPTTDFYRGIQNVPGVPVEKMSDSLVDGSSRFHGVGTFGNGLYFSPDPRRARGYAGDQGMLQRMALKPDAKVITKHALVEEAFKLHGELGMGYNNVSELGRLATWLGYDVIHADDRIVVLNHSKLIIDKSSLVRLPREKSLDLFDIELKFNPNHDRRGRFAASSGGRDLLGDDPSTVSEEWAQSLLDQREYGLNIDEMSADDERISRSGGDVALSRIVDEQWGGAGTVKVADLGNANDANLLFRGVEGSTDYHTGFINGDRFMGKGVYGNGIYFAQGGEFSVPGSALFQDNVGNAWYKAEGYGSNVRKYRISSSAKIVDWEALTAEHTAWLNKTEQGPVRSLTKDPGRYAALKGYDGIKSPPKKGVSQYVIFNRGVLEAHVDRQPDFSFNKSVTIKYNPNHDRLGRFATGSAGGAFTEEDKAAVSTYLKPQKAAWSEEVNHRTINDQLRGMAEHDRPDVSDAITKLDAAFAHGDTIPAGTELYRGIPGVRLSEVYKVGDTFTDYGFSSHSKNEGEAFDFITGRAQMGTANSRATGTLLKAKVTQPTKAIDVAQHFDDPLYKREQEVLLNRGTKFRVTEIYTGPMADIEDVIVEVVR